MPQITETLYVTNDKDWRTWLEKNYNKKSEIWLILPGKDSGKPRISYNDSVEQALCFGWIDSIQKRLDDESTVQRFSPRKTKGNFSQPNIERLHHLAKANQLIPSVLEEVKPEIEKKFVFPDDIMNDIKKNKKAWEFFQSTSPAYQRIRIAYVKEHQKDRPEEFKKRLKNLIAKSEQGKQIGYGGIDQYY